MRYLLTLLLCCILFVAGAQGPAYPHPVRYITLTIEQQPVRMAYMDVRPQVPNGASVLLLHGKNFNGYYWKDVIARLAQAGYRVIVPDQVGWGLSDKPGIHYSFHLLARNTKALLDSLGIKEINVVGHSMGGMLAARFALMYPDAVRRLVLENPIGLEDYRQFVPYRSPDEQFAQELKATPASLKSYQQSYFPQWKAEYDQYVDAQWRALQYPDFRTATWASALTYNMIYEQPVVHEFKNIRVPTLLIIGQEDRTIVGKALVPKALVGRHGNYPELGRWLQATIKGSKLLPLPGVGHIPHVQSPGAFHKAVLAFLAP
ncbi:MAG: alpha/beta hydrolase [Chitinophagaceae bacterium]|nr:MAG: alpha/beta hydrolase [Chitinophagaceae bacterium]